MYPTYKDYLFAEHMAQYPTEFGTMLQDGKTNTNLIGRLTFEDIYGKTQYRYPAAAAALDFGITVDGMTTGLEAGAWWLPGLSPNNIPRTGRGHHLPYLNSHHSCGEFLLWFL